MDATGWEIQPAGWILLFIVIVLLAHYIIGQLPPPSHENQ
jgi:hypothetical protein